MLDRPPCSTSSSHSSSAVDRGVPDRAALVRFLVHRQFNYLAKEEEDDDEEDNENFVETRLGDLSLGNGCTHVGWNGRWNKKADTCYCWWVAGTLSVRLALAPQGKQRSMLISDETLFFFFF